MVGGKLRKYGNVGYNHDDDDDDDDRHDAVDDDEDDDAGDGDDDEEEDADVPSTPLPPCPDLHERDTSNDPPNRAHKWIQCCIFQREKLQLGRPASFR